MRAPYRSAQRVTTIARNVLVTVLTEDGAIGYGEAAPATYVTGETQVSILAALAPLVAGAAGVESVDLIGRVRADCGHSSPGAVSAVVMAVLDAEARTAGVPFCTMLAADSTGDFARATDLSLPILAPEAAGERAAQAARDGFSILKLKVGSENPAEDAARVRAVAAAAPRATLRLDGNQGFTGEGAVEFFAGLANIADRIELFEQPTKAGDDAALAFVSRRLPIPIFADESVHSLEDVRRLIGGGVCAGVVLKLAKTDPTTAFALGVAARESGGTCLFGCMMETRVAMTAALHVALALGRETVPRLDLDGHLLVNDADLVIGGLMQNGETISIDPSATGLGLTAKLPLR
jgi:L-alanine-DL-glutamate epimerase-like enolase superfamily enzyme